MELSIVIVSYNTKEMLRNCLRSLPAATEGLSIETFVVDNASPDGSAEMVRLEFPEVHLIANTENAGFTRGNNQALKLCTGQYIVLLNPDTEAEPGSLTLLARYLEAHPEVGAVGPKLLNTDGSNQPNGRRFPTPWIEFLGHSGLAKWNMRGYNLRYQYQREDFDIEWETDQVTGACLMLPRAVLEKVGVLEEAFYMYYEETELCWRIKQAGWKVMYVPQSRVVHHWMGSARQRSKAMTRQLYKSAIIYYRKTAGFPQQLTMRGVVAIGWLRNEWLYFGVAIKRVLRSVGLIR
jgi:GT2 family glycosyltransferase